MQDYQKIGMAYLEPLLNNPMYKFYENIGTWWIDKYFEAVLKGYFTPFFIAGVSDNISDLLKPQTYSICKI